MYRLAKKREKQFKDYKNVWCIKDEYMRIRVALIVEIMMKNRLRSLEHVLRREWTEAVILV